MDDTTILDQPWPPDLDPADVPFRKRSVTILRRLGYFADPALFNTLTEAEVWSWTNAGVKTVADIREAGNEAIRQYHEQVAQLPQLEADMIVVAGEPWAKHIWHLDPRFGEYLPKVDSTVFDIASSGAAADKRLLWGNLDALRASLRAQASLPLPKAVVEYVEAISDQHGERLRVLLARTGLNGRDSITNQEMARRLGVSDQRVSQIVQRLWHHRDRCRPPDGVWMPQVTVAERVGWPDEYTGGGMEATMVFFESAAT